MNFNQNRYEFRIDRWNKFHAPNAAMLRLELEREGYRVYQWGEAPGAIQVLHKHWRHQSHWIVSGQLEISAGRFGTYTLAAGDRDFLPAETWYSAQVAGEETVVYLVGEKI